MKTSTTKMKEGLLLTLAVFVSSLISCDKKDPVTMVSQETLLTANVSKSWRITMNTRDTIKTLNATCKTTSIQNLDNKLVFTKGGAFRYDNGTITEDVSCQVNGCCTDLANLIGNWIIRNDSLVVTVNARIDNGVTTSVREGKLFYGKITKLEEKQLVLSNKDVITLTPTP